jgi:hypothetical protein
MHPKSYTLHPVNPGSRTLTPKTQTRITVATAWRNSVHEGADREQHGGGQEGTRFMV